MLNQFEDDDAADNEDEDDDGDDGLAWTLERSCHQSQPASPLIFSYFGIVFFRH